MSIKVQTRKYVRFELSQNPTFEELRDAMQEFERMVAQTFTGDRKAERQVFVIGHTSPGMVEVPSIILEAVGDY